MPLPNIFRIVVWGPVIFYGVAKLHKLGMCASYSYKNRNIQV